jgi:AraC family transcriptional regulator of adaptative response/methylated-DNA-[protein]-cysteine methyltransferase
MTPGDYKRLGAGLTIHHGRQPTPFGDALVLLTERGVCGFEFVDDDGDAALAAARAEWPSSEFVADQRQTADLVERMFSTGQATPALLLRGSRFQIKVWSALMQLPEGQTVSYSGLASAIGMTGAARAVGQAVARNPLALLVPCHRVLKQNGAIEGYRWGDTRKRALLAWEAVRSEQRQAA